MSADSVSHSCRCSDSAKRRAFSIAMPAVAASADTMSSSSAVNVSPSFLVRYRLPKTSSRTRTGTPRNPRIGGWSGGKPTECSWTLGRRGGWHAAARSAEPSSPLPSGRCPIDATVAASMPTCTNSSSPTPSGETTPRAPYWACASDDRGLDDAAQHGREVEVGDDRAVGLEETIETVSSVLHVTGTRGQQRTELVGLRVRLDVVTRRSVGHHWTVPAAAGLPIT